MYNQNFVVIVKSDGNIVRERNGSEVWMPFGTEYSILLKNLNSKRAAVKIKIDGRNVLDENKILVNANDEVELKGFLKGSDVTNKFKFIERTKEIEEYRGIKADDGIIRVEYWFEKEQVRYYPNIIINPTYPMYPSDPFVPCGPVWVKTGTTTIATGTSDLYRSSTNSCSYSCDTVSCSNVNLDSTNSDGITVKGSKTSQHFNQVYANSFEDQSYVITLKLVGCNSKEPIFVNSKMKCETCGKECKSNETFCSRCGTYIDWEQQ